MTDVNATAIPQNVETSPCAGDAAREGWMERAFPASWDETITVLDHD